MIFSVFSKKIGFGGILGPPSYGIGATIRIGREMICLPYAGFLSCKTMFIVPTLCSVSLKKQEAPGDLCVFPSATSDVWCAQLNITLNFCTLAKFSRVCLKKLCFFEKIYFLLKLESSILKCFFFCLPRSQKQFKMWRRNKQYFPNFSWILMPFKIVEFIEELDGVPR